MNIGAQKRINAILQNVQSGVSPEFIEKGKTAQVGEIREWNGQKMQKTVNGWIPVKEGTGSKGEHRFEDKGGGKFELEIPGKGGAQIAEGNGQFEVKVWNKDFQYLTDSGTVTLTDRKRLLWQNYFQGNLFPMQNRLVFLICIQKQCIKLTICLHNAPGFIVRICKRKHIPDKPGHPVSLTFYGFQKSAGIFPVRFHCLYT